MHGNEITISLDVDEARRIVRELRDLGDVMKDVPLCLERLKRQIRDQLPPSAKGSKAFGA